MFYIYIIKRLQEKHRIMESAKPIQKAKAVQPELAELLDETNRQITTWKSSGPKGPPLADRLREEWNQVKSMFLRGFGGSISIKGNKWRIPWAKILGVALVLYVLTFKDLQFSLDMKAPLSPPPPGNAAMNPVPASSAGATAALVPVSQDEDVEAYIARFKKVAFTEMKKYGIPANVKMAQGILESKAGTNTESQQNNNHFGRPMAGKNYNSAWANWRAHSEMLKNDYPELFRNGKDYRKWAKALESSGYNLQSGYAQELIRLIENYDMDDWKS